MLVDVARAAATSRRRTASHVGAPISAPTSQADSDNQPAVSLVRVRDATVAVRVRVDDGARRVVEALARAEGLEAVADGGLDAGVVVAVDEAVRRVRALELELGVALLGEAVAAVDPGLERAERLADWRVVRRMLGYSSMHQS